MSTMLIRQITDVLCCLNWCVTFLQAIKYPLQISYFFKRYTHWLHITFENFTNLHNTDKLFLNCVVPDHTHTAHMQLVRILKAFPLIMPIKPNNRIIFLERRNSRSSKPNKTFRISEACEMRRWPVSSGWAQVIDNLLTESSARIKMMAALPTEPFLPCHLPPLVVVTRQHVV